MLLTGFSITSVTMFIVALLYTLVPHDPKAAKAMVAMPYFLNPSQLNWGPRIGWRFIYRVLLDFFLPETKGRTLEEIDELFSSDSQLMRSATRNYDTDAKDIIIANDKDST
ncbi:hypothetical protein Clacol_002716 [Clathrus columnatus]|uniref:Uncharacterized protein n=1 Tax=Clathrus columnatus TaxID=1419009 RepID=A0AAV5A5L6_9AGAM|nr:hypothetical protein Clacol_002716 [Clathrus columnatus]